MLNLVECQFCDGGFVRKYRFWFIVEHSGFTVDYVSNSMQSAREMYDANSKAGAYLYAYGTV